MKKRYSTWHTSTSGPWYTHYQMPCSSKTLILMTTQNSSVTAYRTLKNKSTMIYKLSIIKYSILGWTESIFWFYVIFYYFQFLRSMNSFSIKHLSFLSTALLFPCLNLYTHTHIFISNIVTLSLYTADLILGYLFHSAGD